MFNIEREYRETYLNFTFHLQFITWDVWNKVNWVLLQMLSCLAEYEICSKKKRSRKCTLEYRADKWVQKRNQRKSHSNFAFLLLKKMRVGKIIYRASFHLRVIYLGKLELICKWAFSTINSTREVVKFHKKIQQYILKIHHRSWRLNTSRLKCYHFHFAF